MNIRVVLCLFVLGVLQCACGGGGSTTPPPQGGEPPIDGSAVYADAGCAACHGSEGEGGLGPDVTCYPVDGLDAYLRTVATPHVGGATTTLADADLLALATFLDRDGCAGAVPPSHTDLRDGIAHRPGDASSCAPCHGSDGEGFGRTPACATCHSPDGSLTCAGCHAVAQDNGDGVPANGRRAMTHELTAASHHVGPDGTDEDCLVCHDMSRHREGAVRLWNVDHPGDASVGIVLNGDPLATPSEAAKLETFCLACHDADAADGQAPFSTGAEPAVMDATLWATSAHAAASMTCFGDGVSGGCHGSGHGTEKRMLLGDVDLLDDGVVGDTTREEEGFCYRCHSADGTASADIESEFSRTHRHKIGSHDQGDDIALECSSCHDAHLATSSALLRDPDDGGVWTGTMQAFCLTCHDGTAPDGVAFPSSTTGTGYDKSAFVGTTHATELGSDSCVDCHRVHGSAYRDLLFDDYVMASTNQRTAGDYDACWDCHNASTILTKDDAFSEYHKKHVIDEDATCAACHDVHAGTDSAEPGLISFALAIQRGWSLSLPGQTTLSSAFLVDALLGRGSCTLTCHSERHNPERYER